MAQPTMRACGHVAPGAKLCMPLPLLPLVQVPQLPPRLLAYWNGQWVG